MSLHYINALLGRGTDPRVLGYFTTYLQESTEGPSRKYYKLTDSGRKYLYQLMKEWDEFTIGVNQLIKEGVRNE